MKKLVLLAAVALLTNACATGVGHKMAQADLDKIKEGSTTRDQVRSMFGPPMTQMNRESLECDSYAYTGVVNYGVFTKQDKAQSYNFCYDKSGVVQKKDGLQM